MDTEAEAATEPESVGDVKHPQHPWPYLAEFFSIVSVNRQTYRLQCLLCLPKVTECSAYFNSPSNLKKHVERVHPGHKEQYEKLVAAGRKRKADNTAGNTARKLKQPRIDDAVRSANTVTQQHVNEAIVNFVIGALMPLSAVEVQEFKDLITTLQPKLHSVSRPTLRCLIVDKAKAMKLQLVELLKEQEFVATTTDGWTTYGKSYLGKNLLHNK